MHISKPCSSFCVRRRLRRSPIAFCQKNRIHKCKPFSDARSFVSSARFNQPVLLTGLEKITLEKFSQGVWPSPGYLNSYIHIEARHPEAEISIGDGVFINNNAVIIVDSAKIGIDKITLIGTEFTVYDSDFHGLHPERRMSGNHATASVTIGENIFIGSRVTVLKGVVIGDNSVISAESIISNNIPSYIIAGCLPAKIIKYYLI
jgi:acetyltransferase-like isoleucine patch superfamily enzyme